VPVISAVGHETDFTIADFVADMRAPTPSAAADMVISSRARLLDQLDGAEIKLRQAIRLTSVLLNQRLHRAAIDTSRFERILGRRTQNVDDLEYRLKDMMRATIDRRARSLSQGVADLQRRDVRVRLAQTRERWSAASRNMEQKLRGEIERSRKALDLATAHLTQLSPVKILERGYAIVEQDGKILKTSKQVTVGKLIRVRLSAGELDAKVSAKH
jgi:exodeoxyribonuclease VII large subunit